MIFLRFFRWLLGYVEFEIRGGFSERFFNLCVHSGLGIWNFQRKTIKGKRVFSARVRARVYKRLRKPAKATGVRLKIIKKAGLPLLMHRYRKRSGILIGALLFLGILFIMSQFVWSIQVIGAVDLPESEIIIALNRVGVREGMLKSQLDVREAEHRMMLEVEQLSWIALNLRGTELHVEIRERVMPPDMVPQDLPCNIYASATAVIKKLEVLEGWAAVKVGDSVAKGDLLVSGINQPPAPPVDPKKPDEIPQQEPARKVHAQATIVGETIHICQAEIQLKQKVRTRTGQSKAYRRLGLFSHEAPLYIGKVDENAADVSEKTSHLKIFGLTFPITLRTTTKNYVTEEEITLTEQEAKIAAEKQIAEYEKDKLALTKIIDKKVQPILTDEKYTLWVQYLCEENIAYEEAVE